ncbi:hypothetical protein IRJ41_019722, partial [Triplophysa rosa]
IASRVYEEEVSKFLKIKSHVWGVLEILVGSVAFVCILLYGVLPLIVIPVLYVLTGSLTVLAACTCNLCLLWDVTGIVLTVSGNLVLVFSVVVAATSCSCCCRPKSRSVAVSYVSTAVPANSVGLLNQSDPSASPQPVSSVVCVLPSTPPPNYSPTTSALPAYYSPVSTAPPTDYNSVPTSPPPPYGP